jgi:hypothetical protein
VTKATKFLIQSFSFEIYTMANFEPLNFNLNLNLWVVQMKFIIIEIDIIDHSNFLPKCILFQNVLGFYLPICRLTHVNTIAFNVGHFNQYG